MSDKVWIRLWAPASLIGAVQRSQRRPARPVRTAVRTVYVDTLLDRFWTAAWARNSGYRRSYSTRGSLVQISRHQMPTAGPSSSLATTHRSQASIKAATGNVRLLRRALLILLEPQYGQYGGQQGYQQPMMQPGYGQQRASLFSPLPLPSSSSPSSFAVRSHSHSYVRPVQALRRRRLGRGDGLLRCASPRRRPTLMQLQALAAWCDSSKPALPLTTRSCCLDALF